MTDRDKGTAIQFIEFLPRKGFNVTKEAVEFLTSIGSEQVGVVAIAGKYRTGKSFFVNRILLDQREGGFGVGNTVRACTKGLWMWSQPIASENPDHPGMQLLVIDTEGFGGIEENQNHDSKIFLLAILLSSYFIYNSMGTIDETALQALNLVINMAKEVKISDDGGELTDEDIAANFPSFLWVVRDFALKLVSSDGRKLSPPEYLENCLQPVKGVSENVENKNKIRRLLKTFFQDRDCVTIVRPAETEEELQKLNELESPDFRKEFMDMMLKTKQKILRKTRPKRFNHQGVNGTMLLELARSYVEVLNSGKTPNIRTAWAYLMENENGRAIEEAIAEAEKFLSDIKEENFFKDKDWKEKIKDRAMQNFVAKALGDVDEKQEFKIALEAELGKRMDSYYNKRMGQQKEIIKRWIGDKGIELLNKLKENKVVGYQDCEQELEKVEQAFRREYDHLPKDMLDSIIHEFRADKQREMFSWIQMEAVNQQKREKQALEMRLRQANEEKERQQKLDEARVVDMNQKLQSLEAQEIKYKAKLDDIIHQSEESHSKFQKAQRELSIVQQEAREREAITAKEMQAQSERLINDIETLRQGFYLEKATLEKRISLLEQELAFRQKEIKDLSKQLDYERDDKKRLQKEVDSLKDKLEKKKDLAHDEMIIRQEDYLTMESTLQSQYENQRTLETRYNEERLNRQLAENKLDLLEEKLNENKNMSGIIIDNLRSQLKNEDLNRSEISHLKRLTESESDSKVKKLEATLEKMKMYKFIFKYAQTIQCAICSRFFSSAVFVDHVLSELPADQNPFRDNELSILRGLEEKEETHKLQAITVSIGQTMVREEPNKSGSSFTEYVIQVRTDSCNWNTSRRYRAFCELHNQLVSSFPFVKFPAVAKEIFGTKDNLTKMLNSRKPTVIEERRLNLQNYLRDLLKIEILCNSKPLREFLELEKYYDSNNMLRVNRISDKMQQGSVHEARGSTGGLIQRGSAYQSDATYHDNMSVEEKQKYFLRQLNKDVNRR